MVYMNRDIKLEVGLFGKDRQGGEGHELVR